MWAQLQTVNSKPEKEHQLLDAFEQLHAIEQPDSGLPRTMVMRSQADPGLVFVLVLFASEEKARAREQDPRREAGLKRIRAALGDVLDGPPEFFDLNVVRERVGLVPGRSGLAKRRIYCPRRRGQTAHRCWRPDRVN